MQLSQKLKLICDFFLLFLNLDSIFERFFKKDHSHSGCISEVLDSEKRA